MAQSATYAVMVERAPADGHGAVSALWNLAYDLGYGVGPLAFAAVVGASGYPAAFALTGLVVLAGLRAARGADPLGAERGGRARGGGRVVLGAGAGPSRWCSRCCMAERGGHQRDRHQHRQQYLRHARDPRPAPGRQPALVHRCGPGRGLRAAVHQGQRRGA